MNTISRSVVFLTVMMTVACVLYGRPQRSVPMCVKISGENCYISAKLDKSTDILYWFKRCMANELYTFYRVGVVQNDSENPVSSPDCEPDKTLNLAFSDNIGPFAVEGKGWLGGNHLSDKGERTAVCQKWSIKIDGKAVRGDTICFARTVKIDVKNKIGDNFADETVEYVVRNTEIAVSCRHHFTVDKPVMVNRYYGMQSMFMDETTVRTEDGLYGRWTPIDSVSQFSDSEWPRFHLFEESDGKYKQICMISRRGLGDRCFVEKGGPAYIGNSWGKSYHCLMWNHIVKSGDKTHWKGWYRWDISGQ